MNKEELWEIIIAKAAGIPIFPVLLLFSIAGLTFGMLMIINPSLSIEIQRRFYYRINWKIEPVSLSRELRTTRLMGWFLVLLSAATLFFSFTSRLK